MADEPTPAPISLDIPGLLLAMPGLMDALRIAITGQTIAPPATGWRMGNYQSATRLDALEPSVAVLQARLDTLTDLVGATRADVLPRLALAEASQLANSAADSAQATGQEALRLKTLALESKQANLEAAQALVQARLTQDEAAIALAQTTATAAKTKADADETAAADARAIAIAARDTANANQVTLNALNARFRLKRMPVPAISIGNTGTLNVVWDTPFADDNYNVVGQVEGLSLLGLGVDITARTKEGCTAQIKNGLGVGITLASASVSFTATHN